MRRAAAILAALSALLSFAAACSGDDGTDSTPATATGTPVPSAAGTPDGLPDAYILYRIASGDLVAQNLATGEAYTQVVDFNSEVVVSAQCTPDGSRIGYLKQNFRETTRQLLVRGAGAPEEPLALPSTVQGLAWSPDGAKAALSQYDSFSQEHRITVLDLATEEQTEIARGQDFVGSMSWSPDGTTLAYFLQALDTAETNVFLLPVTGGEPEQLTPGGETAWYDPDWSPDGSRVLVAGLAGDTFQLHTIEVESREMKQLTDSEIFKRGAEYSPDGGTIAYTGSIILAAVAGAVRVDALHSYGIFLVDSDGTNERAFTADPRLNPGATVDPYLDAYFLGWCRPGPWLDELWTPGAPETPAVASPAP